jgi:hypothetical protein
LIENRKKEWKEKKGDRGKGKGRVGRTTHERKVTSTCLHSQVKRYECHPMH